MDAPKSSPPAEVKLHFLDYWRIIRIRKTVILAVFLLVLFTTTAITFLLPESYMSMVRIAVEKNTSDITPLGFAQTAQQYDPYFITTEFEKIRSKTVLYRVIEEMGLLEVWKERFGQELKPVEAFEILKGSTDVRQTRNTSLIEIRVYSSAKEQPAKEAADIANKIAEVYRDTRLELQTNRTSQGIKALTQELQKQDEAVKLAQVRVDELKKEYNISDYSADGAPSALLEPETVRRLEAERVPLQASYVGISQLYQQLMELKERSGSELRKAILNANPDAELGTLLQTLWTTETSLARMRVTVGVEHPDFRSLAAVQADLDQKVEDRIEGILKGLEVRVNAFKAQLEHMDMAVSDAKKRETEMTALYRDYFLAKRDLENKQKIRDAILLRQLQETVDLQIPRSAIVEITDKAEPSLRPVRPNIPVNIALGVIVGLVVGIGLAFFIEYLDTSVKTIDDVERALGAPVLGVIPQNVGSLLEEGPESPHAEAYRVLRTNLIFSRKRDDATTLTVVSGGAGEGKSTTIFNLASVFATNDQRVLLVDSDLRRPSLHKILKVSNSVGLTNYLLGQSKLEEVVQTTSLPTLHFLPSGKLPSSSLGILNSPQMKEFIQDVKRRYDFVFFDSPPIMGVSDASVLASMVDLTLLVIQYRKYPQAMTLRAKQMVEKVGGTLLGMVLNNINISQDSYYYYYSGYYYDYYSKRDDDEPGGKNNGDQKKPASAASRGSGAELKKKY
ncbi:MAG: polysaccharide biosynthesis tyrosine autokinase [Verrucomicrobia bacterium]|nr:polysaccharide biosynthesis tyrosine autokinase [Verrucomicrobiota bacterium]